MVEIEDMSPEQVHTAFLEYYRNRQSSIERKILITVREKERLIAEAKAKAEALKEIEEHVEPESEGSEDVPVSP